MIDNGLESVADFQKIKMTVNYSYAPSPWITVIFKFFEKIFDASDVKKLTHYQLFSFYKDGDFRGSWEGTKFVQNQNLNLNDFFSFDVQISSQKL